MNSRLKTFGIIIGIILTIYLFYKTSHFCYSFICDRKISEHILKNKNLLALKKTDTVFVTDANYKECSQDTRDFVDKKYTRPFISKELNRLGYKTVIFEGNNPSISINGGQPISIATPIVSADKPCYGIHIWTDMYGLIPFYDINIEESYYINDTITKVTTVCGFSFLGADKPKTTIETEIPHKDTEIDIEEK